MDREKSHGFPLLGREQQATNDWREGELVFFRYAPPNILVLNTHMCMQVHVQSHAQTHTYRETNQQTSKTKKP